MVETGATSRLAQGKGPPYYTGSLRINTYDSLNNELTVDYDSKNVTARTVIARIIRRVRLSGFALCPAGLLFAAVVYIWSITAAAVLR